PAARWWEFTLMSQSATEQRNISASWLPSSHRVKIALATVNALVSGTLNRSSSAADFAVALVGVFSRWQGISLVDRREFARLCNAQQHASQWPANNTGCGGGPDALAGCSVAIRSPILRRDRTTPPRGFRQSLAISPSSKSGYGTSTMGSVEGVR